ncbi:acyl carrier protein [Glaciimonas sp. GG7]
MLARKRELEEKIRPLLAWYFGVSKENIHNQDSIVKKFYINSIELMEMCLTLSSTFDIEFDVSELMKVDIVADIYELIDDLLCKKEESERFLKNIGREVLPSRLVAAKGIG